MAELRATSLRETNYRYVSQTEIGVVGIPTTPALLWEMKNDSCVCEMMKAGSASTHTLKHAPKKWERMKDIKKYTIR